MNYSCNICQCKKSKVFNYDRHVFDWSFKGIAKRVLPYFDSIIPFYFPQLKMISSKKKSPFKGEIFVCDDCGYGVMSVIPDDELLKNYYMNDYWTLRSKGVKPVFKKRFLKNNRAIAQAKFFKENINKNLKISKILEIGAAHASSSLLIRESLKDKSVQLYSCESGKQWSEYYKDANIMQIAEYFPFETDIKFDFIHTSHWLEHIVDVNKTMAKINSMLTNKGGLFIEVPNTEFYYWDYPQTDTPHIHFFSTKSLKKLGENNGFECIKINTYGIPFRDLLNGKTPTQELNPSGCYIRALFEKKN